MTLFTSNCQCIVKHIHNQTSTCLGSSGHQLEGHGMGLQMGPTQSGSTGHRSFEKVTDFIKDNGSPWKSQIFMHRAQKNIEAKIK